MAKTLERLLHEKVIVEWQLTFAIDREIINKLHRQLAELGEQIKRIEIRN